MIKKKQNKEDLFSRTVEKYIYSQASENEAREVIKWLTEQKYQFAINHALYCSWLKISSKEDLVLNQDLDLNPALHQIHHRIRLLEDETNNKSNKLRQLVVIWMRIASVLLVPLLIISALFFTNLDFKKTARMAEMEISVPPGSRMKTQLPDGSAVWLNGGSVLRYPASFSEKRRNAFLMGEAFFDIKPDKKHPFVINAGGLNFRVLGTKFNLMAYQEDDQVVLTLESGQVSVEGIEKKKRERPYHILGPGEQLIYDRDNFSLKRFLVDTEKYTSWKDGKLIFRNDPLMLVLERLERWYNLDISVSDPENKLPQHPYTLTVEDETIIQVLEYLSIASPITWKKIPPVMTKDSSISKSRYIISNKKSK